MDSRRLPRFAPPRRLAALLLLVAGVAGAGAGASQAGTPSADDEVRPSPCPRAVEFDPDNFSHPTRIDNRWLPLVAGTQTVFEGRADRGGGALPHTVTFTATNLTKVLAGVKTRVMWDVDVNEGELAEAELAFFAQDDDGNVWNLGEYPEEYEDGEFIGAPNTWIAGIADAEPGIHMLAKPRVGAPEYLQGWAPDIEFLDCAKVVEKSKTSLVTHERSPLDPGGGIQTKTHMPGVGIVEIGAIGDPEGETLVLVERRRLNREEMAEVRKEARALNKHGYEVSEVYRQTKPRERPAKGKPR